MNDTAHYALSASSFGADLPWPAVAVLTLLFIGTFPIWALGAILGLLLPRPKFISQWLKSEEVSSRPLADLAPAGDDLASYGDVAPVQNLPEFPETQNTWYITTEDVEFFRDTVEVDKVEKRLLTGNIGPEWSVMYDKDIPGEVRYVAYSRWLPNGTTEYLSITISPNMSAQEFTEFCLDDDMRPNWETGSKLKEVHVVEQADVASGEQVVVWKRR